MYQHYDTDTFFKAVNWAKRNIRKGKSRLNTYAAAESYYGVDAKHIQRHLLTHEKEFMSVDYREFAKCTITHHFDEFKEYVIDLDNYVDHLEEEITKKDQLIVELEDELHKLKNYNEQLECYIECSG